MGKHTLQVITADLHIHTCLSPCATLDMTPMKIVREARAKHLAMIAITDHNSAENAGAVIKAARDTGVVVIPGIEVTTYEETHLLGLFEGIDGALSMQALVYGRLQPGENDEDLFGLQVISNEMDEVEGISKRLLIGATDLRLHEAVGEIHLRGGLAVAAHIDRERFSVVSQLGFIPHNLALDAVEISRATERGLDPAHVEGGAGLPVITASDAHSVEEIGAHPVRFRLGRPDLGELRLALAGAEGRGILYGTLSV